MFTTLIDAAELLASLGRPSWVIVDCRFSLADMEAGRAAYRAGHIPGAVYAHLDQDLSNPPATDRGRHPLPAPEVMARRFGQMGIGDNTQVVAYDDGSGAIAARLWWMLRYMGHAAVAVLDGGWAAWQAAELPVRSGTETNSPATFSGSPRPELLITMDQVSQQTLLIDSRSRPRYTGESEPIDAAAGHIPGAVNFFYQNNWDKNGRFLPPGELASQFIRLLGNTSPAETAFYCGSGVTACVNLLALAHAGLGNGRLYVGSWSEWSGHPGNPVVQEATD